MRNRIAGASVPSEVPTLSLSPVLALDLGGTQTRAAAVLSDGARRARVARPTPVAAGARAVFDACVEALGEARSRLDPDVAAAVAAVGVSAPGPLDPWRGVILDTPNLGDGMHGFPLAAELEWALGLPVYLERDTNVAALAELTYGAARGCPDFLYLTVSTGFGGAIVTRGELLLGPDGMAGELGHVQVALDGPPCGCGGVGHVEAVCSGAGLARAAREAVEVGRSPFLASRAVTRGAAGVTARDVADGDDAGDPACRELMERARAVFAAACVGYVNAFNPTRIVVGGGIAEHQGERLLRPAREAVSVGTFPVPGRRVKIVPAALGADVALAGAQPLVQARQADPSWRGGRPPVGSPAVQRMPAASTGR